MFEKEAEEIANKRCHEIMCFGHCSFSSPKHHRCGEWHREYNCAKEGIEFGYNKAKEDADKMKSQFLELCNLKDMRIAELKKANEWHYPSKGEYPKNDNDILCQIDFETSVVGYFNEMYNDFFTIDGKEIKVKAWKEIVLPKGGE